MDSHRLGPAAERSGFFADRLHIGVVCACRIVVCSDRRRRTDIRFRPHSYPCTRWQWVRSGCKYSCHPPGGSRNALGRFDWFVGDLALAARYLETNAICLPARMLQYGQASEVTRSPPTLERRGPGEPARPDVSPMWCCLAFCSSAVMVRASADRPKTSAATTPQSPPRSAQTPRRGTSAAVHPETPPTSAPQTAA